MTGGAVATDEGTAGRVNGVLDGAYDLGFDASLVFGGGLCIFDDMVFDDDTEASIANVSIGVSRLAANDIIWTWYDVLGRYGLC